MASPDDSAHRPQHLPAPLVRAVDRLPGGSVFVSPLAQFSMSPDMPGNQHLIRLLQAEIARREDAQPAVHGPAWVAALQLPY